jgi:signal transduction histidine kinase/ActR/RegA family two-component response regulator
MGAMRRVPLRRQLFLIAVAGILPLAVLAGVGLHLVFEEQRESQQRRALEITRALATAVDTELKRSQSALQVLTSTIVLDSGDFASFHTVARRAVDSQPTWRSVILSDAFARTLVDTAFPMGAELPPMFSTTSFDEVIRTGEPRVGYVVKAGGGHVLYLRAPVVRDGTLRYVASVLVNPSAIVAIVKRQRVPADWVISVFDAQGSRVARSRAHEEYVGLPASPSLREIMARGGDEGTGLGAALEGTPIFTAFTRIPDSGWSVAIGVPTADVENAAYRSVALYGSIVLLSILTGLFAALIVGRRVNQRIAQLRAAAQSLGAGRLPPVPESDISEIREVGEAIAAAARQRQDYEAEREELLASEKAARLEAEAANRAKDQFLAMLGHELRNPLAALSNAASVLEMGSRDERASKRAREVIQRQVAHLSRLTDDLLDAASALLGKIELRVEPVNLATIAAQSLATLSAMGRTGNHRIETRLEEAWVRGDPVRLDQIVTNLLVNAVKYTPAGGRIELGTRRLGNTAELTVADNGVGLTPELRQRVFELFVQGERNLDRSDGGLGIGLALVRRLAELHGGDAHVQSEGQDRGSQFTVSLPAVERPPEVSRPATRDATVLARTVLVIEDNDDARETLQSMLELMGHRVDSADDGPPGIDKALAAIPDVVFVDIGLPSMDGFEVARRLRAADGSRMYLVALTGFGAREDRERALAAGFDAHMVKPVEANALARLLRGIQPRRDTRSPA